jgi:hypothetical protein
VELLKRLASLFSPEGRRDAYAYWLHVQCDRCGEKIRTRVDMRNDLSVRYDEAGGETTYFCRKSVMGSGRCFQQIQVELTFDSRRNLIERQIEGGSFVDEEDAVDRAVE